MARKRFSEHEVIQTLMHRGILIWCYRCKVRFELGDEIEREHLCELAIGGDDIPFNCAYSHKLCHEKITNGTKATTAGSSKQRIAKVKRLRGERKPRRKRAIPPKPFQKGVKKPWPKRIKPPRPSK